MQNPVAPVVAVLSFLALRKCCHPGPVPGQRGSAGLVRVQLGAGRQKGWEEPTGLNAVPALLRWVFLHMGLDKLLHTLQSPIKCRGP
jgi:hypothetical protein